MTLKRFALTLAITLIYLMATTTAQAQSPRMTTVNISAQSDRVHITTEGEAKMKLGLTVLFIVTLFLLLLTAFPKL